ncbi:MAG: DUF1592 domain-containing protein [Myxococcota bacterium]|nr:DUF1592 domain-containing protein [Myxococcota bacterium]
MSERRVALWAFCRLGICALGMCALALAGCTGDIGGAPAGPEGTSREPVPRPPGTPSTEACGEPALGGRAPLHRLTHDEYDRSVGDLLGDLTAPATRLLPREADANDDSRGFGDGLAEAYFDVAGDVARRATEDLPSLLGCDPADEAARDACVATFVERFGRRAYRRPVEDAERDALLSIYADAKTEWGFTDAVRLVVQAMLNSPRFLYRVEVPAGADAPRGLDDYEIASRLSYALWGTTPDPMLLDAAERGELSTSEGLEAQARRLVEHERAEDTLVRYVGWWVELDRLDTLERSATEYPEFDFDRTPAALEAETEAFIREVVRSGGGLHELLTASWSMLDEHTAQIYGVEGVTGDALRRVELDPEQRAGILTHGSIVGPRDTGSGIGRIIHRGMFIQARVLCGPALTPPEGIPEPPPSDPNATIREELAAHQSDPYCASCHQYTDPFGLAFEHYDGLGGWLETRNDEAVDASGQLVVPGRSGPVSEGDFEGAVDLANLLAEREDVRDCFARHWFRFTHRRRDQDTDRCSIDRITAALESSDGDFREMLVAVALTDAFRLRAAETE